MRERTQLRVIEGGRGPEVAPWRADRIAVVLRRRKVEARPSRVGRLSLALVAALVALPWLALPLIR